MMIHFACSLVTVLVVAATRIHFVGSVTASVNTVYGCSDGFWIGTNCDNWNDTESPCGRNTSKATPCYCHVIQPKYGLISYLIEKTVGFTCEGGYKVFGKDDQTCLYGGNWSNSKPWCIPKDCELSVPQNSHVVGIDMTTVYFDCMEGYKISGPKHQTCLHTGDWTNSVADCIKDDTITCQQNTDSEGNVWDMSYAGEVTISCPVGFKGNVTRLCQKDGKWEHPSYDCIRYEVVQVMTRVGSLQTNSTWEDIQKVTQNLANVTSVPAKEFFGVELQELSSALSDIATALVSTPERLTDNISHNFIETANNLIQSSTHPGWKNILKSDAGGAISVIAAVDLFGKSFSQSLRTFEEERKTIIKTNIAFEARKIVNEDVLFPDETSEEQINSIYSNWLEDINSYILMKAKSFPDVSVQYIATTVIYRNISDIIPSLSEDPSKGSHIKSSSGVTVNGPVLSLAISPSLTEVLDPPITISFKHKNKELDKPSCVFWQFLSGYKSYNGFWSNRGCQVKSTDKYRTVCECNHLTNFAVLMSPFIQVDIFSVELSMISYISMGISIACLLLTLGIYGTLWKYLKSPRAKLLMNLCVALILAYVIFLFGVERTDISILCTVIAASLHYIYLVVFCLMLTQGIEMAVSVVYVFKPRYQIRWFLIGSWLFPAVIVGISLGITRTEGFGNEHVCWLSRDRGLIWAFVAPSLIVILFNVGCIVLVLRAVLRLKAVKTTPVWAKLKRSLRALSILLPITGVSWILGIFYVHEDLFYLQYVFSVLNGMQGGLLFLFHCLLNPEVKKAYMQEREKISSRNLERTTKYQKEKMRQMSL